MSLVHPVAVLNATMRAIECSTSWLDHVICGRDMQAKLQSVSILDMLPNSEHVPLSSVFDFSTTPAFIDKCTCPSNKINFTWAKATDKYLLDYKSFINKLEIW